VRFLLMVEPSRRRITWAIFQDQRGWVAAIWRSRRRSLASSGRGPRATPLRGTGLVDHLAGPAFRDPEAFGQGAEGPPAPLRGHSRLPLASSFKMSISRAWSATSFVSRFF